MAKSKKIKEEEEIGPHGGIRKMGTDTGYEIKDGKYYIAPCYHDEFVRHRNEMAALDQLLSSTLSHIAELRTSVVAAQERLWDRITADLGLDSGDRCGWSYNFADRCLTSRPRANADEDARLKVLFADALRSVKGR